MIHRMFKIIFPCLLLVLFACSPTSQKKSSKTTTKKEASALTKKDHALFVAFILNLEKTLWADKDFIKTDYKDNGGWQLIDKKGKYIIQSETNLTHYPNDSICSYELKVITIDNPLTNKENIDKTISIPFFMRGHRKSNIDLEFLYRPTKTMCYGETRHYFEFTESIIVNYRSAFNDDVIFTWDKEGLHRHDLDPIEDGFYRNETLWKRN